MTKTYVLIEKYKFWGHFCLFNFQSWRNKSVLKILIFPIKSVYFATLIISWEKTYVPKINAGDQSIYNYIVFKEPFDVSIWIT